jgi:hypothetical protein
MGKPAQVPSEKQEHKTPAQGGPVGGFPANSSKPAPGHEKTPGRCGAVSCKTPDKRFGFCEEHYEQFKFGLIKKSGEMVSDYEKKFEHYEAYKKRQVVARKAA